MAKQLIALAVEKREASEKPSVLRRHEVVPGIIYGSKVKGMMIKCSRKQLHKTYIQAGENTLVEIQVDGQKIQTLIHAMSFDPVTDKEEHVDFYAVDMSKKVTTHVPVVLKGESLAVKEQSGILVTVHDKLTVTCLPNDIPESFIVDISVITQLHQGITVGSLKVPNGVTIDESPETVIVTVQEQRAEEVAEVAAPVEGAVAADGTAAPDAEGAAAPAAGAKPGAAPSAGAEKKPAETKARK